MNKFIVTGTTFDKSDYKKEVNGIVELWDLLKNISLDCDIRNDRVLASTIEVETVGQQSKTISLNDKTFILPSYTQIEKTAYRYALTEFPKGNTGEAFANCHKDYYKGAKDMRDIILQKIS
jgi:hypothetical protein